MQPNIDPLIAQIQSWWTAQHERCNPIPDWNSPDGTLGYLFKQEPIGFCGVNCGWRDGRTRDQLILSLRPRLKAGAVEAAQILEQPQRQAALQLAQALVPRPVGTELTVVADLIEAAGAQTVQDRNRALAGAGIALVAAALLYLLSRG